MNYIFDKIIDFFEYLHKKELLFIFFATIFSILFLIAMINTDQNMNNIKTIKDSNINLFWFLNFGLPIF